MPGNALRNWNAIFYNVKLVLPHASHHSSKQILGMV